jgi:3-phenylpropionate/cinnamic acid dioxygenase small subunit
MDDEKLRRQIEALHTRYIQFIDDDKLEEWPSMFTEACRSRGMMQDRVTGREDSRRIETLLVIPL